MTNIGLMQLFHAVSVVIHCHT